MRVLIGSGLCGLRSARDREGFRESRWAGGARIWVHLESERMGVSVSSGTDKGEEITELVYILLGLSLFFVIADNNVRPQ